MKNDTTGFRVIHEQDSRERPSSRDRLASFLRHRLATLAGGTDSADADVGHRGPVWVGWVLGAVLAFAGIALVAGGAALAVWLLGHIGSAAVGAASPVLASLGDWGAVQAITVPVRGYFTAHAATLPITVETLWRAWAVTGVGLLVLSWTGSFGARVGWVLIGATTAAMVHAAAPAHGVHLSTGITAIAWGVLSVLAFAGAGRSGPVIVERPATPPPPTESTREGQRQESERL